MTMREQVGRLVDRPAFQWTVVGVIAFNAITLGLETSETLETSFGRVLHVLDSTVLGIFAVEMILRIYAKGARFFRDPWGVFDLLIVLVSFVPAQGALSVLRSARILRALRLIPAITGMKRVVGGLLRAIPGMVAILVLLALVLYVGAVLATELYGGDSPEDFGHLGDSLFTLFQVMTGEAWPEIADRVMSKDPVAWIFFVLFILTSTFVVLNLFTAVVVSAIDSEREAEAAETTQRVPEPREPALPHVRLAEVADVAATEAATVPLLLAEIRALRADTASMRAELAELRAQRDGV